MFGSRNACGMQEPTIKVEEPVPGVWETDQWIAHSGNGDHKREKEGA